MENTNLYKALDFTKATTSRKSNGSLSLEGTIKRGIRETIHKFLLDNYSHLYLNLDTTTIIKQHKKLFVSISKTRHTNKECC